MSNRRFDHVTMTQVLRMRLKNVKVEEIQRVTGVHASTISKMLRGMGGARWKELPPEVYLKFLEQERARLQARIDNVEMRMEHCRRRGA